MAFESMTPAQVHECVFVALLSDERYKWRSTARLAEGAGVGENEVPQVAARVCARQDHDRNGLWGLIDRVGA